MRYTKERNKESEFILIRRKKLYIIFIIFGLLFLSFCVITNIGSIRIFSELLLLIICPIIILITGILLFDNSKNKKNKIGYLFSYILIIIQIYTIVSIVMRIIN